MPLTGDVVLTQGGNVLTGDRMLVNLQSGTAQVQGRVRSVLQPGGNLCGGRKRGRATG